jgi:hypothetical protein
MAIPSTPDFTQPKGSIGGQHTKFWGQSANDDQSYRLIASASARAVRLGELLVGQIVVQDICVLALRSGSLHGVVKSERLEKFFVCANKSNVERKSLHPTSIHLTLDQIFFLIKSINQISQSINQSINTINTCLIES